MVQDHMDHKLRPKCQKKHTEHSPLENPLHPEATMLPCICTTGGHAYLVARLSPISEFSISRLTV